MASVLIRIFLSEVYHFILFLQFAVAYFIFSSHCLIFNRSSFAVSFVRFFHLVTISYMPQNGNIRLTLFCSVGEYTIDPNEGCSSDAVKVYCDFEKNATCVNPKKTKVQENIELNTLNTTRGQNWRDFFAWYYAIMHEY